jgi:hypothetical protein
VGARVLTGVDELLVPAVTRAHGGVWEGRLGVRVLGVVARCTGGRRGSSDSTETRR